MPEPDQCWQKELDFWEADISKNEHEPHPILQAAIRKLRKIPPPPAQSIVPVHGDMRAGNFLFNEEGNIKAILDWGNVPFRRSVRGSNMGAKSHMELDGT